jgi:pimeloyl-ACP methyl ester carboxylesterase
MPQISINDIQLSYNFIHPSLLQSGRPLLVFLHEGLGCSEQWKDFHTGLCVQLSLPGFYYDRHGYGQSQEVQEPRQHDFLDNEAEITLPALFEKLNLSHLPKIIFGHSDGGTIALLFAAKFPEQTIAVITEAAHVINEEITMRGQRDVIKLYETTDLPAKLARYHGSKTEKMFRSWINVWQSEEMSSWSIEHKLQTITCPVLAIQGSDDNYGSPEQLRRIKKHATKAHVTISLIENCGHVPHHQSREKVEQLVLSFLKNY